MTFDDLERPFRTQFQNACVSEPTTKIWMKIDSYYRQQRCSAVTVVSENIRFMRIFAGVPWRRGVERQWGNRTRRFSLQGFRTLRLRNLRKWGQHYYIVLLSPLPPFPLTPEYMTLNDLEWPFYVKFCFFAGMSRALKPGFRSLATLKLVLNVAEHQKETNGIAQFPCDIRAFL